MYWVNHGHRKAVVLRAVPEPRIVVAMCPGNRGVVYRYASNAETAALNAVCGLVDRTVAMYPGKKVYRFVAMLAVQRFLLAMQSATLLIAAMILNHRQQVLLSLFQNMNLPRLP